MTMADDATTVDIDPGAELVDESNRPGANQRRNVGELLAGGVVVVHRTDIERQAHNAGDRFRRNPRDRSDGRLDAHGHSLLYGERLPVLGGYRTPWSASTVP